MNWLAKSLQDLDQILAELDTSSSKKKTKKAKNWAHLSERSWRHLFERFEVLVSLLSSFIVCTICPCQGEAFLWIILNHLADICCKQSIEKKCMIESFFLVSALFTWIPSILVAKILFLFTRPLFFCNFNPFWLECKEDVFFLCRVWQSYTIAAHCRAHGSPVMPVAALDEWLFTRDRMVCVSSCACFYKPGSFGSCKMGCLGPCETKNGSWQPGVSYDHPPFVPIDFVLSFFAVCVGEKKYEQVIRSLEFLSCEICWSETTERERERRGFILIGNSFLQCKVLQVETQNLLYVFTLHVSPCSGLDKWRWFQKRRCFGHLILYFSCEVWFNAIFFLQKRVLSLATREYMLGWTTDTSVWHEAAAFAWHNVPH